MAYWNEERTPTLKFQTNQFDFFAHFRVQLTKRRSQTYPTTKMITKGKTSF